jgi:hypothetical protein
MLVDYHDNVDHPNDRRLMAFVQTRFGGYVLQLIVNHCQHRALCNTAKPNQIGGVAL